MARLIDREQEVGIEATVLFLRLGDFNENLWITAQDVARFMELAA